MKLQIPKPFTEIDLTHETPEPKSQGYVPNNDFFPIGKTGYIDQEIRQAIVDDCTRDGFVSGAVVVHKRIGVEKRIDPFCWGIIIIQNSPTSRNVPWKPLRVRWLSGSYEDVQANEIVVMIFVPDQSILKRRAVDEPKPIAL